jgi:hypothetical protein
MSYALIPKRFSAITPSDTANTQFIVGLFIGIGGDVAVQGSDGVSVTFKNVSSAAYLSGNFYKILATGTTATNIVGLHNQ